MKTKSYRPSKEVEAIISKPYRLEFEKDPEGGYFVGVSEWPGCMSEGKTIEEAAANIHEAMALWVEANLEMGVAIPPPLSERPSHSGKFLVRVPKSLHRRLAERAEEEGVSLNQLVVSMLSQGVRPESPRIESHRQQAFTSINLGDLQEMIEIARVYDRGIRGGAIKGQPIPEGDLALFARREVSSIMRREQ